MFSTTDTIVAIATTPGRGGIGVVRVSGPRAHDIALSLLTRVQPLAPRHATMGELSALRSSDQVVATYFPRPASYTGDDVVEISAHGTPVVLRGIVEGAIARGARLAEPGEFTLRAYLNGRIDLTQAEAVADLIDAVTPLQARTAFDQLKGTLTRAIGEIDGALFDLIARLEASVDFPDEGYHFAESSQVASEIHAVAERTEALLVDARRGRLVREGFHVAIAGRPNAGKSSLFNALVGTDRAIVTDVPGTTRDLVTETIDLEGLRVTLVDTAGLRDTGDTVESQGVARAQSAIAAADVVVVVVDRSQPPEPIDLPRRARAVVVLNKADLPQFTNTQYRVYQHSNNSISSGDRSIESQKVQQTIGVGWISSLAPLGRSEAETQTKTGDRGEIGVGCISRDGKVVRPQERGEGLPSAGAAWRVDSAIPPVEVSTVTGQGMSELRLRIAAALDVEPRSDPPGITNVRHIALVERAHDALARAEAAAAPVGGQPLSEEFVLADLQDARAALEEITGRRAPDDLLAHIFARFCIGK